jgi:hypothetical protein
MKTTESTNKTGLAVEKAKTALETIIAATPTIAASRKELGKARQALAAQTFTSEVTYAGTLAPVASKIIAGEKIQVGNVVLSYDNPASAKCVLCGGTHGVVKGQIQHAHLLAQTLVFLRKNGDVFFLSNSGSEGCYQKYVRVHKSKILSGEKLPS